MIELTQEQHALVLLDPLAPFDPVSRGRLSSIDF